MAKAELIRQMAEEATRPLHDFGDVPTLDLAPKPIQEEESEDAHDLFVWFENTSDRLRDGQCGMAGLPECLIPVGAGMRVIERHYVTGHAHLLSAARIRCQDRRSERIAAIYTAALAVGTVAWIGSGLQYELAWNALYTTEEILPS